MNFNSIKKLLTASLKELEIEILTEEPDLTDEELKLILDRAKVNINELNRVIDF